jgi:phosphatidylserine/phosphatidylglycerophosphate/cardiolipin synthase-like enzyme
MAKFLTTSGVSHEVENIVKEAKKKLVLISPYIQINKMLLERLKIASAKGVQITFIYGKTELNLIEKKQLESIENLKLYFYPNLHAKCYFNEKLMVITSMNLYAFSEKNNREMGILINKVDDIEVFNDAVEEALSIVKSAQKNQLLEKAQAFFHLKKKILKL